MPPPVAAGRSTRARPPWRTASQEANLVVVCTPVDTIADFVSQSAASSANRSLITDAGSTKREIVQSVETLLVDRRDGPRFVGSHPLAGDHRTGVDFARGDLFEGRKVIVTPTEKSHRAAVVEIGGFWQSLGADVVDDDARRNTIRRWRPRAICRICRVRAGALATPKDLLPLAASGWRDTTRIAGGDPEMWRAIFATNRQEVLDAPQAIRALDRRNPRDFGHGDRTIGCCGSWNGRNG